MANLRIELDPILVPDYVTHLRSYWYKILLPVSGADNWGHLPWAEYRYMILKLQGGYFMFYSV